MIGCEIRPALESEAAQIKSLIRLVGINPTGLAWRRFVVAANRNGQVVACGQIKPHGTDVHELASIAVHPDYRARGLARSVIEFLLKEGERPLYLMCMSHNGPMYEKFGFRVIEASQMPRYFVRIRKLYDVAVLFRKPLEDLLVMKLE